MTYKLIILNNHKKPQQFWEYLLSNYIDFNYGDFLVLPIHGKNEIFDCRISKSKMIIIHHYGDKKNPEITIRVEKSLNSKKGIWKWIYNIFGGWIIMHFKKNKMYVFV